ESDEKANVGIGELLGVDAERASDPFLLIERGYDDVDAHGATSCDSVSPLSCAPPPRRRKRSPTPTADPGGRCTVPRLPGWRGRRKGIDLPASVGLDEDAPGPRRRAARLPRERDARARPAVGGGRRPPRRVGTRAVPRSARSRLPASGSPARRGDPGPRARIPR